MSDIHALSGAYAINAVDDVERARFERHLQDCPECVAEVSSLQETAVLLSALAADGVAVAPSADLRERVLTQTRTVRPLPPLVSPAVSGRSGTPGGSGPERRRLLPGLVAAAVVAVLGIGVGVAVWPEGNDDTSVTLTASERVLADVEADRVVLELGEARATLVRSSDEGRAVLVTEAMPPAPEGKVYELWFQSPEGDMVPAGLMPRRTDQTVLLDGDAREATAVGITIEPKGGSPKPSGEPIALFELG